MLGACDYPRKQCCPDNEFYSLLRCTEAMCTHTQWLATYPWAQPKSHQDRWLTLIRQSIVVAFAIIMKATTKKIVGRALEHGRHVAVNRINVWGLCPWSVRADTNNKRWQWKRHRSDYVVYLRSVVHFISDAPLLWWPKIFSGLFPVAHISMRLSSWMGWVWRWMEWRRGTISV